MGVVAWIVFGIIVGAIAYWISPSSNQGGIISAMILGILGALIGGFLANLLLGVSVTGFNFTSIVIAILGSLLLLFVGRSLRRA